MLTFELSGRAQRIDGTKRSTRVVGGEVVEDLFNRRILSITLFQVVWKAAVGEETGGSVVDAAEKLFYIVDIPNEYFCSCQPEASGIKREAGRP